MKKYILPILILIVALTLSSTAAFWSISGLYKLFAGAGLSFVIMASSLEVSKLLIASIIHQYWKKLNILFKTYLISTLIALMVITSLGVYGFLTSQYQKTSDKMNVINKELKSFELRKSRFVDNVKLNQEEKSNLDKSIQDLRLGLTNNKIQYKDKDGDLITTTSSSNRKVLESQLNEAISNREKLSIKIENQTDSIYKIENQILESESKAEISGELGPLKYLSNLTGKSMDKVVNWIILTIVFIFDPLAIMLLMLFNKIIKKDTIEKPLTIYGENIPKKSIKSIEKDEDKPIIEEKPTGRNEELDLLNVKLKELNSQLNPSMPSDPGTLGVREEIGRVQDKIKKIQEEDNIKTY